MSAVDADGRQENTRALSAETHKVGRGSGPARRLRAPISEPEDIITPIRSEFRLETGGILPDPNILVRRFGRRDAPSVVVMGGISSDRRVAGSDGWWSDIVGVGAALDLAHHSVLGIDFAPLNDVRIAMCPRTQARLLSLALDELGIERLHAVVGASYGGMIGLAFAALAPERVGALCVVSAAHKAASLASAWRGVQRRTVEFALENGRGPEGLALARQLAMATYRSAAEFDERFHGTLGSDGRSDLDRYLIARGRAYADVMGAQRWLSLSEAIDRCWVSPEAVLVPTTLVACPTDQLVPFADMHELASRLPRLVALHTLPSTYGHDAFLKEHERLGGIISTFLEGQTHAEA